MKVSYQGAVKRAGTPAKSALAGSDRVPTQIKFAQIFPQPVRVICAGSFLSRSEIQLASCIRQRRTLTAHLHCESQLDPIERVDAGQCVWTQQRIKSVGS